MLKGRTGLNQTLLRELSDRPADDRVPVRDALEWLNRAVRITRDPDLGLRALSHIAPGSYAVLEYLARTATNYGEALELQLRYIRLVNEAANFTLHVRGTRAHVELRSRVPLPRAAADFQSGALLIAARSWLGSLASFEAAFAHEQPEDCSLYEKLLPDVRLSFGAPNDSICFDARLLETPFDSADPELNATLRQHAERLLQALPEPPKLAERVRKTLLHLLPAGDTNAEYVAARLGVSRRTFARHLEREGVTYKDLLEQARRELATQYLSEPGLEIEQIALRLGYSETAAFSRAFRRWSGQSPAAFRRALFAQRESKSC
jgi:AraC-like DNA-binding protein